MDTSMITIVGQTIVLLFLYIALGFTLRKVGIIDDRVTQGLTGIFLLASLPGTILNSTFNQVFDPELAVNILIVFLTFIGGYLFFALFLLAIGKALKLHQSKIGIFAFAGAFGNIGLMGMPVVNGLWGSLGVFYAVVATLAYFVMLPTLGVWLSLRSADKSKLEGHTYKFRPNAALIAAIVGLTYYFFQDFVPTAIVNMIRPAVIDGVGGGPIGLFIGGLAATTTPISMIMIGSILANSKFSQAFKELDILVIAIMKLLAAPVIFLFILRLFITDPTLLGVLIILNAMPAASLAAVYAEKYKADSAMASQAVVLTTLLALFTIPLVAIFL